MRYKFLTYFLISIFISIKIQAQILDTTEMDKMNKLDLIEGKESDEMKVLSASRSNKKITDLPIAIQVITKEEIEKNGYITLVDVLKHIGGIRVSQPGSGFDGEMFTMRGLIGNYYTKILLNSIPLQPSVSGSLAIAEQLPIAQAERIEIIFGPASSIYGADAMAGVINIITKSPQKNAFVQANLVGGEYGYRAMNFMVGGKVGRDKNVVKYTFYGNYAQRDDLNILKDTSLMDPTKNIILSQFRNQALQDPSTFLLNGILSRFPYYKGTTFEPEISAKPQSSYLLGAQIEYKNFQFTFNEMYRKNHSAVGLSPLTFSHANPNTFVGDFGQRFTLSYNKDWERWSLTANLSYNLYRIDPQSARGTNYDGFGGISYKFAASDDIFGEVLARFTSRKNWEWTFGGSFQISSILPLTNDLVKPFDRNDYKPFSGRTPKPDAVLGSFGYNPRVYTNRGIFIQVLKTQNRWTFIGGVRADLNTGYESVSSLSFAPIGQIRASLQYKIKNDLSVRFSLGSAFKAPSPNETYVSLGIPTITINGPRVDYQQIPNPELKPENLGSFEMGLRYYPNEKFSLETIIYAHRISRKIIAEITPVDTIRYNNYVSNSSFSFPIARTYLNDENSSSQLISIQILAKYKNLIPTMKMNIDANFSYSRGVEQLPDNPLRPNDGIQIQDYRMMPRFMGQLNIDFEPYPSWYVRIENVLMSSSISRFVVNNINDYDATQNSGYYTLDLLLRNKLNKNTSIYAKVTNIFSANYAGLDATGFDVDLPYNPQYLRFLQFGLNFKLD